MIRRFVFCIALAPAWASTAAVAAGEPSGLDRPRAGQVYSADVRGVALGPDGRWLAAGFADGSIRIWATESGREIRSLKPSDIPVHALAVSRDGRLLAVILGGSLRRYVELWEWEVGRLVLSDAESHLGFAANHVSFSPDGRFLATAHSMPIGGFLALRDLMTPKKPELLDTRNMHDVTSVSFSPDGRWMASGNTKGEIKLWDVATRKRVRTIKTPSASVSLTAFPPGGDWVAAPDSDGATRLWDMETGREARAIPTPGSRATAVFSPEGRLMAAGNNGSISVYEIPSGRELQQLRIESDSGLLAKPANLAFSNDGTRLVASHRDGAIRLWDVSAGRNIDTWCLALPSHV